MFISIKVCFFAGFSFYQEKFFQLLIQHQNFFLGHKYYHFASSDSEIARTYVVTGTLEWMLTISSSVFARFSRRFLGGTGRTFGM